VSASYLLPLGARRCANDAAFRRAPNCLYLRVTTPVLGLDSALETQSDEHQRGNRDSRDHERNARDSEKSAHVDESA
jgi:hypothetical protein